MNTTLLFTIGAIVTLIFISFRFDFHIGPLAVLAAMVLGKAFLAMNASQILAIIPAGTILTMIVISGFYGFALENGTALVLIQKLINRFGKKLSFFPILIFFATAVLSGSGLGSGNATMILAPLALTIAAQTGLPALTIAMAVGCGAAAGSNFPFSFGGSIAASMIVEAGILENGIAPIMDAALKNTLVQFLSFIGIYLLQRVYRFGGSIRYADAVLTPVQKKTAALIAVAVAFSVLPQISSLLFPCSLTKAFAAALDINTVMLAGIVAAMLMRLAPEKAVASKHIPWLLIIVISGMSMLIGLAKECGVVALLNRLLSGNLFAPILPELVMLVAMLMSLFGGTISIVLPTIYPVLPSVAIGAGVDLGLLYGNVLLGATCGGLCPYSSGGMIMLSAFPSEGKRHSFLTQLMLMPFYQILIAILVCTLLP